MGAVVEFRPVCSRKNPRPDEWMIKHYWRFLRGEYRDRKGFHGTLSICRNCGRLNETPEGL